MSKKRKTIPEFSSEEDERRFWETHDSADPPRLEQGRARQLS